MFPPFLGPISPDKKYCLVLDLDETLIHNVEVSKTNFWLKNLVWGRKLLFSKTRLRLIYRDYGLVL